MNIYYDTGKKEKVKAYLIYEASLKELNALALASQETWGTETVYKYNILDRESLTPEQREKQAGHSWDVRKIEDLRVTDTMLSDTIKQFVTEEIANGRRTDIYKTIYNKIMNSKVKAVGRFFIDTTNNITKLDISNLFVNNTEGAYEYDIVDNEKELKEKLKDAKGAGYNYGKQVYEVVMLEEIEITIRPHSFKDIDKRVEKAIKKYIRNELSYCIRNDKIIVPEEYLAKGESGIEEWRQIKRSSNKNNSIEKQLLKEIVADKKKFATQSMWQIMNRIATTNSSWSIPTLEIDGRYNNTRTKKLVNQIIDVRDKQGLINMSEEDIIRKFKDYWMDTLMDAYNNVKNMVVNEGK